jgi:uncharacterized protein YdeI (YjbR/CyaY-like superfamily)
MEVGRTLRARGRAEWRRWLERHHRSASEIWLVFYTKASGKRFVAYNEAVEEALCFGWIDSIVKKLPGDARAQRFTPRRAGSRLSELNKARVRRLIGEGRMTPAGLAAAGELNQRFKIPRDIEKDLRRDADVWRNFHAFPESYKRIRIGWIDGSRGRPDVFKQRLDYFVRMTRVNKRFGTMP